MNPGPRMAALEREAVNVLLLRGYEVVTVSDIFRNNLVVPYNLTACRIEGDGSIDKLVVKLKISPYEIVSLEDAKDACRDETRWLRRLIAQPGVPADFRFEVWITTHGDSFCEFGLTRDGIRETRRGKIRSAGRAGGAK